MKAFQKREAAKKRAKYLIGTLGVMIILRLILKNPEPPKAPDHSNVPFKALPGMLDAIPVSARSKLDPKLVVQMMQADEDFRRGKSQKDNKSMAFKETYKPADLSITTETEEEKLVQEAYQYAKKMKLLKDSQNDSQEQFDPNKSLVIRFASGGYVFAQDSWEVNNSRKIKIDQTMQAGIPNRMVESVTVRTADWKESVPKGFVKLKPAKGITAILNQNTAKKISIKKLLYEAS
ncbi:MAG: hypothetical protein ACKVQC_00830 [Elusimicrobiota bacterium]